MATKVQTDPQFADETAPSVIGAHITVTGNIEAVGDLQLDGTVTGDVRCSTLVLGERSVITGNVFADRVLAAGKVDGSIDTKDLALETNARVTGDILYSRIRVAEGATIQGAMQHRSSKKDETAESKLRLIDAEKSANVVQKPGEVYID